MELSKRLMGAACIAAVWTAPAASADDLEGGQVGVATLDCGESVTAEILGVLRDAGNIDQAQYEALCRKARGEAPAAAAAAPAGDEPTWDFKWSNGFKLSRSDGAYKLKFGGRVMLDSAFIWVDNDLRRRFEEAGIDPKDGSGIEARRARLFFSGTVYDRVFFKVAYEFSSDPTEFKDVYMGLKELGPIDSVQVGQFKEPFLLEEWTSSKYLTFMERGLNNVFFPGRNVGLMAMGDGAGDNLLWQLGLFRVTDGEAFAFDEWGDEEYDVSARVTGTPLYSDDGSRVIHLGLGYIHRFRETSLRYRQRPEVHLAQRFVDTRDSFLAGGDLAASDADILNAELAGVFGPFSVQTEWTYDWVQGRGAQQNVNLWGGYVFASWFLTGEHRNYEHGKGRFGRVKPKANFNPAKGDWGAWELAARYSYLDLDDENIHGGKLWDVTVGLNWYLVPNLRWMLNYVHGDVRQRDVYVFDDDVLTDIVAIRGTADVLETRFQIDF